MRQVHRKGTSRSRVAKQAPAQYLAISSTETLQINVVLQIRQCAGVCLAITRVKQEVNTLLH